MPLTETERGKLYFADHRGDDLNPPLLLIHGAAGTHLDWSIQLRKMNSIVPDLPGHGKSALPGRANIGDYAADMVALLDALHLDTVIVCGQSMGGAIALTMALEYPARVQRLILIGTGAKLAVQPAIMDRIVPAPSEVGTLLKTLLWGKNTPETIRQRGYELFMKLDPQIAYNDYLACNQFDVRSRLPEIMQPTLVIGAADDQMAPFRFSEYLADHILAARLVRIENAGHMMTLEAASEVAEAIHSRLKN